MDLNYWNRRKRNDDEGYPVKEFNSNTDDSQFQRDRARIIHSAAFRRLQTKTQVLGLGENDFYRTRLTHSLEVAQIGSAICERLHDKYKDHQNIKKWIPSLSLIEAIGLSHDIGHPPFGHGGEVALNYSMITSGGFEGNGQTLRIVSRLAEYSPHHGMDLTRRTLL
ncbi:TPA: dNTP triphosphohydrolase, partial [Yersinia enterocolitica]|nr:dNTP triphosphohydrolase [Yersinia enterocolitica]